MEAMTIPFQSAMSSSWTSWMIPNSACWPGLQQWNHHFYIFLPSWLAFFYVFLALNMEVGNQDLIAFFIGLVLVTEILRFGLEDMIDCCSAVPLILIGGLVVTSIFMVSSLRPMAVGHSFNNFNSIWANRQRILLLNKTRSRLSGDLAHMKCRGSLDQSDEVDLAEFKILPLG